MDSSGAIEGDRSHQAAISAARRLKRATYTVRHRTGLTLNVCLTEQEARAYVKGSCRSTHHIEIYRLNAAGELRCIHRPPMIGGGFIMADLCKVIHARKAA